MLAVSLLRIWNEATTALVTTGYSLFHIEAQIVCAIVLAVIFTHQLNNSVQDEARIYWLRLLFAQFLYCLSGVFRVLVNIGIISTSQIFAYIILALNFASMHISAWLVFVYSELCQDSRLVDSLRNKILSAIPLIINLAILIVTPATDAAFQVMSGQLKIGSLFKFMMTVAPLYLFVAGALAIFRRSRMTRYERDTTNAAEFYPMILFLFMIIQSFNWKIPVFCYAIMIADIYVYIKYSDSLVSIDPLTKIANRNGLTFILSEYLRKLNTAEKEPEKDLYVFAVDIDGLNTINSSYVHISGDQILILVAEALKKFSEEAHECFISRYYRDEFILVADIQHKEELEMFAEHVRNYIGNAATAAKLPYHLRVNVGWAKYEKYSKLETVSGLIEEATRLLNENAEQRRFQTFWTAQDQDLGGVLSNENTTDNGTNANDYYRRNRF